MKKIALLILTILCLSTTVWADPIICGSVHLTIYNTKAQIVSSTLTATQSADDILGVESIPGAEEEPTYPLILEITSGVETLDDVEITSDVEEPDTTSIEDLLIEESDEQPDATPLFEVGEDFDEEHND